MESTKMPESNILNTDFEEVEVESPPAKISIGTGTITGLVTAAVAALPLLIDALSDERLSETTRKWLIIAIMVIISVLIISRAIQAVAVELKRG
jgi:hypothetical protein